MIVTLLFWFYLACMSLIYGVGTLALLRRVFSVQDAQPVSPSVVMLAGLIGMAWISSLLSLFINLGLAAHILLLVGSIIMFYLQFPQIRKQLQSLASRHHVGWWLLALLVVIATLLYTVKLPKNPDTILYHAQAIHWIEEYPAVPGLGNLEPRLGSNTNWFTLNALFSLSFLGIRSFHLVPSFLFLISIFYFLGGLQNLLRGDIRLSQWAKLGFVPFAFYALVDELSSPGTDLPVILFYWLILCLWLEALEEGDQQLSILVFVFSVFAVTFKMSGIAILLIALLVVLETLRKQESQLVMRYAVLGLVLLFPWLFRNFILTGYWLYPEPALQFFSPGVDWQIPTEHVLRFKLGVQAWALSAGTRWEDVAGLSMMHRLGFWFSNLTFNQKAIAVLGMLSPLFFLVAKQFDKKEDNRAYLPLVVASTVCVIFWMLSAPNLRFGYGFLLGAVVLAFAPWLALVQKRFDNYRVSLLVLVILLLSTQQVRVILGSTRDDTRYSDLVLLPADYAPVPTEACTLDGADIFCARRYRQCSYEAFPCVPQIPKDVELRGDTLRDGFHRTSTTP